MIIIFKIIVMFINIIVVGDILFWLFLFMLWFLFIFFIVVMLMGFLVVVWCLVDLK